MSLKTPNERSMIDLSFHHVFFINSCKKKNLAGLNCLIKHKKCFVGVVSENKFSPLKSITGILTKNYKNVSVFTFDGLS